MSDTADRLPEKSQPSSKNRRKAFLQLLILLVPALLCLVWYVFSNDQQDASQPEPNPQVDALSKQIELPPIAPTRFRNASLDVAYVGNQACVECHPGEHESYLHTNHSRSLEAVDVSREPPDGEFFHELSGRHYRVKRDGETLRLSEFIKDSEGEELVLADYPARFALGSGNYARMYFVQHDDYLVESPMTWYPRKQSWGMSAGFEKDPQQPGFSREVSWGCLNCHAGRVEMIDNTSQRLEVLESAISCERCHGPGALHVAERKANLPILNGIDDTIVNLEHLSRERQEDVCSQCHLSSAADVNIRGRNVADFRPGMRMSDFRVSFRVDREESVRTVSGQIEQMRLSRCYIESESMTCFTCHNPHRFSAEEENLVHHRNACLSCHQSDSCGKPLDARQRTTPADNCIACHMPKGPTDIPHFSFTHHRIGIHADESEKKKYHALDQLTPVVDISHLPTSEQQRLLGLANEKFGGKLAGGLDDESRDDPEYRELSKLFKSRAHQILSEIHSAGLSDPAVELFFSGYYWRTNPQLCIAHAEAALESPQITPELRQEALFKLSTSLFDQGQYDRAFPHLKELVTMERSEISLMLLAICYQKQGNLSEAERLVKLAIDAEPTRADLHTFLASIYRELGRQEDAQRHQQKANELSRTIPQPG